MKLFREHPSVNVTESGLVKGSCLYLGLCLIEWSNAVDTIEKIHNDLSISYFEHGKGNAFISES